MNKSKWINMILIIFGLLTILFSVLVIIDPSQKIMVIGNILVFTIYIIFTAIRQKYILKNNKVAFVFWLLSVFLIITLVSNLLNI
ncbi:MAG: hypothetical protein ACOCRK_03265 [bacterium]